MAPPYAVPLARIPIVPAQGQSFNINLNGTDYRFRLQYNDAEEGGWVLDIGDAQGAPIVCGISVVSNTNLLGQYEHLQIGRGGALFVANAVGDDSTPTFAGLGEEWQMFFGFPTSFNTSPLSGLSMVPTEFSAALARPPLPTDALNV